MGISGMNGLSDQQELTTPRHWTTIRDWAKAARPRPAGVLVGQPRPRLPRRRRGLQLLGIAQADWEFTRITAQFG